MSSPAASEEYWRQNAAGSIGNFFGNAWESVKNKISYGSFRTASGMNAEIADVLAKNKNNPSVL